MRSSILVLLTRQLLTWSLMLPVATLAPVSCIQITGPPWTLTPLKLSFGAVKWPSRGVLLKNYVPLAPWSLLSEPIRASPMSPLLTPVVSPPGTRSRPTCSLAVRPPLRFRKRFAAPWTRMPRWLPRREEATRAAVRLFRWQSLAPLLLLQRVQRALLHGQSLKTCRAPLTRDMPPPGPITGTTVFCPMKIGSP